MHFLIKSSDFRKSLLFLMGTLALTYAVNGQGKDQLSITITERDWTANINVLNDSDLKSTDVELEYHWFKAQHIHTTTGDFTGRLLDGEYEKFDASGNLIEKGQFEKGLKVGTWKIWFASGDLQVVSNWNEGLMHGDYLEYAEGGGMITWANYKKGKLHGTYREFENGELILEQKYKNGTLITPKEKKIKTKKSESDDSDEQLEMPEEE